MRNSKKREKAEAILKEVFELTSEEYLKSFIDEPMERILADFQYDKNTGFSNEIFLDVIGAFVLKLHIKGPSVHIDLPHSKARAEAVSIIEKAYGNEECPAYDAALAHGIHDISNVLSRMAEFIINRLRNNHQAWVFRSRIDFLDWSSRCLIAEILLNQWASLLPSSIRSCKPAYLADAIPHLIKLIKAVDHTVNRIRRSHVDYFMID